MTVAAATTSGAADRSQCAAGLCPCLFRRTGFDQKHTLVVHPVGSVSRPLDHSVPDINRIKRHIAFVLQSSLTLRFTHQGLLLFMLRRLAGSCCLILNNPGNNYCQPPQAGTPDRDCPGRYLGDMGKATPRWLIFRLNWSDLRRCESGGASPTGIEPVLPT